MSPAVIALSQHGRHTLQALEIHLRVTDMHGALAATGNLSALRTLRIEFVLYTDEHIGVLEASASLVLARLARFEVVLFDVNFFTELGRWLARCQLPGLEHFAIVSNATWPSGYNLVELDAFTLFFAVHQDLRVLSVHACESVTQALLTLELPPGLRRISLGSKSGPPSTLPALPPALRQLALRGEPEDSSLWDLLAHLLREPSLSLTEIIVVIEEIPSTEHPECVRSSS
jgi:hypothetical protein